jgi:Flp pilus assembly protein protease CpaA
MTIIALIIVLIALAIGTYTDFKTREVPDWVNKGLIAIGIGLSLLFSAIHSNWNYFLGSLAGFAAFFILAIVMYYSGQWGGGDSKMIMGIGAVIGFNLINFNLRESFLLIFLFNLLITGAVYGLLWSIALSIKNFKKLVKEFKKTSRKKGVIKIKKLLIIFSLLVLIVILFVNQRSLELILFLLLLFVVTLFYMWIYIKAVENVCMLKYVTPDKLTEGDWIAKNIKVNKKVVAGPKDLGIEKKQINQLVKFYKQRKLKKVLIKEGIPFVPSFFIAYIVSLFFGNLLWLII